MTGKTWNAARINTGVENNNVAYNEAVDIKSSGLIYTSGFKRTIPTRM